MYMNEIDYGNYYDVWPVYFYQTDLGIIIIVLTFILVLSIITSISFIILKKVRSTPEKIAKRELKKIEQNIKNNDLNLDILYLKLTQILKNYVQKKYQLSELTDLELINHLNNITTSEDLKTLIAQLISNAEAAKYAFKKTSEENLKIDINNTLLFINKTSRIKNNEK